MNWRKTSWEKEGRIAKLLLEKLERFCPWTGSFQIDAEWPPEIVHSWKAPNEAVTIGGPPDQWEAYLIPSARSWAGPLVQRSTKWALKIYCNEHCWSSTDVTGITGFGSCIQKELVTILRLPLEVEQCDCGRIIHSSRHQIWYHFPWTCADILDSIPW